jgi:hypothetical protein
LYVLSASPLDRTVRLWAVDSGREIAVLAGRAEEDDAKPAVVSAVFNSDGTQAAIVSGEESARIVRVFPTSQSLVDYARTIVPRELTRCERKSFFLPFEGEAAECPN